MKYLELTCTAYVKNNIDFKDTFEILSKYISFSMAQDASLKAWHEKQGGYKHYSFGSFFPIEKEKVYKQGENYTFKLRSPDEAFIKTLAQKLHENINNPHMLVVDTQIKRVKQFFVTELYSLTPVIVSVANGKYWTMKQDGDIEKLQKQLHDNIEKKYKDFYGEALKSKQNFIQLLVVKNQHPQNIWMSKNSKSFRFFGNKFRIVPHEDEVSQKLAFLALSCGLGEKNAFGGGFCFGRGVK